MTKMTRLVLPLDAHASVLPPLAVGPKDLALGEMVDFNWKSWVRNEPDLDPSDTQCEFQVTSICRGLAYALPIYTLLPATNADAAKLPRVQEILTGAPGEHGAIIQGHKLFEILRAYRLTPGVIETVSDFSFEYVTNEQIEMFSIRAGEHYRKYANTMGAFQLEKFGEGVMPGSPAEPESPKAKSEGFMPAEGVTYPCRHCGEFCESGITQHCEGK